MTTDEKVLMPCPVCRSLPIPKGGCIHYGEEMVARRVWQSLADLVGGVTNE